MNPARLPTYVDCFFYVITNPKDQSRALGKEEKETICAGAKARSGSRSYHLRIGAAIQSAKNLREEIEDFNPKQIEIIFVDRKTGDTAFFSHLERNLFVKKVLATEADMDSSVLAAETMREIVAFKKEFHKADGTDKRALDIVRAADYVDYLFYAITNDEGRENKISADALHDICSAYCKKKDADTYYLRGGSYIRSSENLGNELMEVSLNNLRIIFIDAKTGNTTLFSFPNSMLFTQKVMYAETDIDTAVLAEEVLKKADAGTDGETDNDME